METIIKKLRFSIAGALGFVLLAGAAFSADNTKDAKKKKKPAAAAQTEGAAEPDRILYDRSMADFKRGKYTEARLSLQTLINTYPDSEYLAKAKLAIGDSFYKEGGTGNLTQSIETYKDFITFFPFLDESAYAQMQVGMAHFRMMEKADRDNSQAQYAEDEFQTFLLKYPNSPLVPKAEQHLREVQEVLADGDFRVAQFYYVKGPRSYRAALARLNEIIDRYPLYTQSDKALWMAGNIYDKSERREVADKLYARIVREYPSSKLADDAKGKLTSAGVPVPQADPAALARAVEERKYTAQRPGMIHRTMEVIHSGPDVSMAAHSGQPNLQPPAEATSAVDILKPGSAAPGVIASGGGGGASGNSVAVETVPAGSDTSVPASSGTPTDTPPADTVAPAPEGSALPAPMNTDTTPAPTAEPAPATGNPEATPPTVAPAATATESTAPAAKPAGTSSESTTTGTAAEPTAGSAANADPSTESTSKKKKKGLKKIVPW
ncbi:MAG: outer membrane protein assembly factor BamD [Candidatus Acidiferrales bacterium]|jgi:outer membrane protein assembly factor BamD